MPSLEPTRKYQEISTLSAGKLKSVLLLMDRAITFLKEAEADPALLPTHAVKIQNILAQLEHAVNFKEGNLAKEFFALFDYLFEEIGRRDAKAVATALRFFSQLRDALRKAARA